MRVPLAACAALLLVLSAATPLVAAVTTRETVAGPAYELSNRFLTARVVPGRGGKVVALTLAGKDANVAGGDMTTGAGGLCKERLFGPGSWEPAEAAWEVLRAATEGTVDLLALGTRLKTPPHTGLQIEKTYRLDAGRAALEVEVVLTNTSATEMRVMPWFHHLVAPGGAAAGATSAAYLPTPGAVVRMPSTEKTISDIIRRAGGSWMAVGDDTLHSSLVCAFANDPPPVRFLYSWMGGGQISLELIVEPVTLAPAKSVGYRYSVIPCGIARPVWASPQLVVGASDPGRAEVMSPAGIARGAFSLGDQGGGLEALPGQVIALPMPPVGVGGDSIPLRGRVAETEVTGAVRPLFATPDRVAPATMADINAAYEGSGDQPEPVKVRFWTPVCYVAHAFTLPLHFGFQSASPPAGTLPRVRFDLPQTIELRDFCVRYWWWDETITQVSEEAIERDGLPYRRYTFEVRPKSYSFMWVRGLRLLVRATAKQGTSRLYYRGQLGEVLGPERSVPVEIVTIDPVTAPKRIQTAVEIDHELVRHWEDFVGHWQALGLNTVAEHYNLLSAARKDPAFGATYRQELAELQQHFRVEVMGGGFFAIPPTEKDQPSRAAVDIDGRPTNRLDFMFRDADVFARYADRIAEAAPPGFTCALSDWEPYFGMARIGFGDGALAGFKAALAREQPGVPYVDPREAVRNPAQHPQVEAAWSQYKADMFSEMLQAMVDEVRRRAPGLQLALCTITGDSNDATIRDNLQDYRRLGRILDRVSPMLYNNIYHSMPKLAGMCDWMMAALAGGRAELQPVLSAGYADEGTPNNESPAHLNKYIVLETILGGARGYQFWPGVPTADALDLKYISQANRMIAAAEDVLWDRCPVPDGLRVVSARNQRLGLDTELRPRLLSTADGKRLVAWVSEYSEDDIEVELALAAEGDYTVRDLDDNRELPRVAEPTRSLKVKLGGDVRGKLLLLERIGAAPGRPPQVTAAPAAATAQGRLFARQGGMVLAVGECEVVMGPTGSIAMLARGGKVDWGRWSLGLVPLGPGGKEAPEVICGTKGFTNTVQAEDGGLQYRGVFSGNETVGAFAADVRLTAAAEAFTASLAVTNSGPTPLRIVRLTLHHVPPATVDRLSYTDEKAGAIARSVALQPSPAVYATLRQTEPQVELEQTGAASKFRWGPRGTMPAFLAFISVANQYYLDLLYLTRACFEATGQKPDVSPGATVRFEMALTMR